MSVDLKGQLDSPVASKVSIIVRALEKDILKCVHEKCTLLPCRSDLAANMTFSQ